MSEVLHQVTQAITADDLPRMVLNRADLPAPLRDFLPARSGFLDNHSLAEQGLPGSTAERFREVGRLTGYLQEFLPAAPENRKDPARGSPWRLPRWSTCSTTRIPCRAGSRRSFCGTSNRSWTKRSTPASTCWWPSACTSKASPTRSAGLRVLQSSPEGPVSSTVVDFRVGRLLGVAYVVTLGNYTQQALTQRLGQTLERRMVQAILEVPNRSS